MVERLGEGALSIVGDSEMMGSGIGGSLGSGMWVSSERR